MWIFFFLNLDHSHPFYIITIQSCKTKVQQRLLDTVYRWCFFVPAFCILLLCILQIIAPLKL